MKHLVFHDPIWLVALLAIPLIAWLRGRRHVPVLLVPFAAAWHRPSLTAPARWPVALAVAGLALLIAALARPQRIEDKREIHSQGYDIMLCVDVSGSMMRHDGNRPEDAPSRVQVIKPIIQGFIDRRPHDRIGLVLFGRKAYTLAPLTFDHDWISRQLSRLKIGMIDANGTVIGDGLGTAVNRLDQEQRISEGQRLGAFIVLLTDGGESIDPNTRAPLSLLPPLEVAKLAEAKKIPIYTIGVGRDGYVWEPVEMNGQTYYNRVFSRDVDPEMLRQIAEGTGGHFFRAEDPDTIEKAFDAIDHAKKIEFQAKSYLVTTELFWWLAVPGAGCLLIAALAARPVWRKTAFA
jgi:Ca-activated chloride channel family protein